ncbi:MAG: protein translocase subunit SecD [Elusimicrobia bacterium]|nr:protein translocase subunit SecD [Elusimicrobiota bacterium]
MSRLQLKWVTIAGVTLLAAGLVSGSARWYLMPPQEREELERFKQRPRWLLNLGLDLKGGTHLLMELDASGLPPEADLQDALARAIEVLRNRVDQFGVSEPLIARQGERWIVVQLPGIKSPDQAKEIIGKTALLEFRLVEDSAESQKILEKVAEFGSPWDSEQRLRPEVLKLLGSRRELFAGREGGYYVLQSSASLTGAVLTNARIDTGGANFGFPTVNLQFDSEGARAFEQLTGAHIGKNLAILLDGVVHSAPVIRSRIPGGTAQIEGNFTLEQARNLAIVLRAGALPAPVRIIEERTVGPSLGEDSIRAGVKACGIGIALVFVFMVVYYRFSGLVADLALLLNLLYLLGAMSYFHATLTLPGVAGILLTLGMAVDANVLIFERIREELRLGKSIRVAVDAGYDKAFSAILDANLTTLIAAIFLFQFGTGPVKGFALTLTVGLIFSMFTAVFVTHAVFELYLSERNVQRLSI